MWRKDISAEELWISRCPEDFRARPEIDRSNLAGLNAAFVSRRRFDLIF